MSRARVLTLALLAGVGWASVLWADYKESYRKGIEAVDRKEWGEVSRWMRQAANEQAREGEPVKIYGVRFEPYLPYYYLGLALSQTGDCEGALTQWQQSESQGAVQSTSRYKSLVQSRDSCRQRVAAAKPAAPAPAPPAAPAGPDPAALAQATRTAEAEIQRAGEAQAQVARRRNDPELAEAWKLETAQAAEAQAADQMGKSRARLDRGKGQKQISDLQEAEKLAVQARQSFEALLGRLDRRQAQIRQTREKEATDKLAEETQRQQDAAKAEAARQAAAQQEAKNQEQAQRQELGRQLDRVTTYARKILDQAARVPNPAADLKAQQTALRDLLRRAGAAGPATPLGDLDRLQKDIPAATARVETAVIRAQGDNSGPPAELRVAARAFFRADYQEVVRTLASATFSDGRTTAASNLLLAAARYSLYLQGGAKSTALRDQARANVRACRRINPRIAPDSKAFSPRFAEFFRAAE